ncbi:MAG: PDZ domain-containing protein [Bryobacter sp.]|nr:PDZ domain-containing protein [Bryobacter sp.]
MWTRNLAITAAMAAAMYAQPAPPAPPAPPSPMSRAWVMAPGGSYLGIGFKEITTESAKQYGLKEEYGVEVTMVDNDSPASRAGLQKGDVIVGYNGQRVESTDTLGRFIRETPVGREVRLQVMRNGSMQSLTAKLGARKDKVGALYGSGEKFEVKIPDMNIVMPDIPRPAMVWRGPMLGVEAEAIESQFAEFFGVKEGVLVRSVTKGTAAEKAGLKAGDVIVKVDETKVRTPQEVTKAVRGAAEKKTFPVTYMRDKRENTVMVTIEDAPQGQNSTAPKVRRASNPEEEEF